LLAFAPRQCHKRSAMLEDAVYSPDVTLCNLFLFLNLKSLLKWNLQWNDIHMMMPDLPEALLQNNYWGCLEAWKAQRK